MIYPVDYSTSAPTVSPPGIATPLGVVYKLEAGAALPSIDCSKAIKHALLGKRSLTQFNAFLRASKNPMRLSFAVGLILACVGPVMNQQIGGILSVLSSVLMVIPMPTAFLAMRFDMVVLLATTYEFWYFSLVSISSNVLLAMNYGDERTLAVVCELLLYEFALLMDANSRGVRSTITASIIGALALLTFVTLQELDLIKDYHNAAQVNYGTWTLEASNVIANGLCNLSMILLRNAYRKWLAFRQLHHDRATIRCISYRTRLRFVEVVASGVSGAMRHTTGPLTSSVSSILSSSTTSSTRQMRLVPLVFEIHADDLLQCWASLPIASSMLIQRLWALVGGLGIATTVASIAVNAGGDHEHNVHRRDRRHRHDQWLVIVCFVCTTAYTVRCMCFHNRRLLRHILWSFDFLFLTVQSNIAHGILCHLLQWNAAKCMVVWANWCWMYWVVTLDLLTPVVRRRLGIHNSRLPMVVLILQVIGHVSLVRELIFSRQWQIADRALLRFTIGEKTVTIFAVPVLLTRMVTTFCWCLRLLWRLWRQSENELIMIQGAVEYDDYDALIRLRDAKNRLTSARERRSIRKRSRDLEAQPAGQGHSSLATGASLNALS